MHITIVYIQVKPIYVQGFIDSTRLNQKFSIEETGCARFDFLQDPQEATKFILYEAYLDEEAAKAHKNTLHYIMWKETVQTMMAQPRQGIRYVCLNHDEPIEKEGINEFI